MENYYEVKEHIAKLGSMIEMSNLEETKIFLFKKKLEELEKIALEKRITLISGKHIILNNFEFLGYHNIYNEPVYKYIGADFDKDKQNILCKYELVDIKIKNLSKHSDKIFEIDYPEIKIYQAENLEK